MRQLQQETLCCLLLLPSWAELWLLASMLALLVGALLPLAQAEQLVLVLLAALVAALP
jgi:hypothetical protein